MTWGCGRKDGWMERSGNRSLTKDKCRALKKCGALFLILFIIRATREKETDEQMEEAEADLPGADSKNSL